MAGRTGPENWTACVTGRRSNQLNYASQSRLESITVPKEPVGIWASLCTARTSISSPPEEHSVQDRILSNKHDNRHCASCSMLRSCEGICPGFTVFHRDGLSMPNECHAR